MRAMASNRVTKNKEQIALKVDHIKGIYPSNSNGKEHPSKSVNKDSWDEMAMQDAQEREAFRGMFKGSKSLKKSLNKMARIDFCSEGAANQVDWRASMVADLIAKTEPIPGGRSTFLAKREC